MMEPDVLGTIDLITPIVTLFLTDNSCDDKVITMSTTSTEEKPYFRNSRSIRAKEYLDALQQALNHHNQNKNQD